MPGISASALPSLSDMGGMLAYLLGNPYLFISSTTVMTSGIVIAAGILEGAYFGLKFWPGASPRRAQLGKLVGWLAPTVILTLVYFGIGSIVLATEIFLRFHPSIPYETEIQLISGLGHLVIAVLGIAGLVPVARGINKQRWAKANLWAVGYLGFQIVFLTPPWFEFQGQGPLVLGVAKAWTAMALVVGFYFYREVVRGEGKSSVS